MIDPDSQTLLSKVAGRLAGVPGIAAVVLGGSRARDWHSEGSDYDIGLYYRTMHPIDLGRLDEAAIALDDEHRTGLVTPFGGWGMWVNGGAWLSVEGKLVDLIYRDLDRVDGIIDRVVKGEFELAYHFGHPHGFASAIYAGEIATCRVLHDPQESIASRKARLATYPEALRENIVRRFTDEAEFTYWVAQKGAARDDAVYVGGCAFRAISCLCQVLFAINREWLLNEKGAVARIDGFAVRPSGFGARAREICSNPGNSPGELVASLDSLGSLIAETKDLAARTM